MREAPQPPLAAACPARRPLTPARRAHRDAGRRLAVAQQQGEDVVLAVVARLGDERQVGRVGAAVGVARVLLLWGSSGRRAVVNGLVGAVVLVVVWCACVCGCGAKRVRVKLGRERRGSRHVRGGYAGGRAGEQGHTACGSRPMHRLGWPPPLARKPRRAVDMRVAPLGTGTSPGSTIPPHGSSG